MKLYHTAEHFKNAVNVFHVFSSFQDKICQSSIKTAFAENEQNYVDGTSNLISCEVAFFNSATRLFCFLILQELSKKQYDKVTVQSHMTTKGKIIYCSFCCTLNTPV